MISTNFRGIHIEKYFSKCPVHHAEWPISEGQRGGQGQNEVGVKINITEHKIG